MATITFLVKVSGGKFYIDEAGNSGLTLTWRPGDTYIFDQADSSNAGNTLRLSATSDNSGSSEYTTGVTVSGTAGSAGAKTTIITSGSTTATLYYYSGNNSGYGGTFSSANYNTSTNFNLIKPQVGKATGDWGPMVTHALDQIDQAINNITAGDIADATLVTESEGLNSSDNDTSIPTTAAVKDYVDSNEQTLSLIDEDSMSTDSATRPPSQQSVKAYVNTQDALVEAKDALMGYQSVPHIIPGVLYPGISDKQLDGTTALAASTTGPGGSTVASSKYGTVQSDGRMYYYTDIKGSKPIKDPRVGGHFGSQRHMFSSLQLLEQETATHGSDVHSIDGREWIKRVGNDFTLENGSHGIYQYVSASATEDSNFFEITGYFNAVNWLVSSDTQNDVNLSIDGTANSSTFTGGTASVGSPLRSRYVNAQSVVALTFDSTPNLGIHTIKLSNENGDYMRTYGIELIAQDTSNRSNIQIPSQNVVSYGKKFTVSAEGSSGHHYDPFNGFTNGTTTFGTKVDTATSLGLGEGTTYGAPWAISSSNHIRPFNGGRIVKWVDSDGTIKTSVTMMPANAQNWRTEVSNEITTASATNSHTINFSDDPVGYSLTEVAKVYDVREFGNGGANTLQTDISNMTTSDSNRAFVMDDGLTSMTVKHGKWDNAIRSGASDVELNLYVTFIGTGFSCFYYADSGYNSDIFVDGVKVEDSSPSSTNRKIEVTNLPYGTHIIYFKEVTDTNDNPLVFIGDASLTIYQPKKPPIPEEAVIISDYCLMADFVQQTTGTPGHISKGVRFQSQTRDLFYNAAATINFGQQTNSASGFQTNIAHDDNSQEVSIIAFAKNATFKMHDAPARVRTYKQNGTTVSTTKVGTSYDSIAYAPDTTLQNQKFEMGGTKVGSSTNAPHYFGIEIATPIHTSSHYQPFETPYLYELIGGDRNMEQTNLVCSPDGKTWDQITRDTSYIGNIVGSANQDGRKDWPDIWMMNNWRGTDDGRASQNYVQKDFAIALDRIIFLRSGQYKFNFLWTADGGSEHFTILKNGVHCGLAYIGLSGDANSNSWFLHIQRGDYVQIKGSWGSDRSYNGFFIERC